MLFHTLIKSIFDIVLPTYQTDRKTRQELHNLALIDIMQFAIKVKLPFEFTEYNFTPKVQKIISDYEKLCYDIATQNNK